jgi:DMSO/TMAO reductase YedYZ molybdopterin-dependent catalytic subunit
MRILGRFLILSLLVCSGLSAAEPRLLVSYEGTEKEIKADDLAKLPPVEVDAADHGTSHHYRGVTVRDVLALVNAPLGAKLRGSATALVVRVRAADGYVAAFALAEFDAAFREQTILLVDMEDGKPLFDASGPLRLVCPGDKRGARWVRKVVSMEVISLASNSPKKP